MKHRHTIDCIPDDVRRAMALHRVKRFPAWYLGPLVCRVPTRGLLPRKTRPAIPTQRENR